LNAAIISVFWLSLKNTQASIKEEKVYANSTHKKDVRVS
jgi:hypothetical protein